MLLWKPDNANYGWIRNYGGLSVYNHMVRGDYSKIKIVIFDLILTFRRTEVLDLLDKIPEIGF